jgi:hypothetical protein
MSGFSDPEIDAMIDHALEVQAEDPASSGALWAEIDRAIADKAPYLWLVNPREPGFVSERVGNYQVSAQWGVPRCSISSGSGSHARHARADRRRPGEVPRPVAREPLFVTGYR